LKKNIFILTTGLSGSSVVTGLLNQAGFWCGENTEFKDNSTGRYETYENSRFVELNNRLVKLSGKPFDSSSWYNNALRDEFTSLLNKIDLEDFKQFVTDCNSHQPWVLKDPKLWIMIGFWLELFKDQDVKLIIITRNILQLWVSQTGKRIIYDYKYLKNAEQTSKSILINYLKAKNIDFLEQEYELLISKTSYNLQCINGFLKTNLKINDWNNIYNKNQYIFPFLNGLKALLIYIKNYSLRIR
jgi:hypothetical protein